MLIKVSDMREIYQQIEIGPVCWCRARHLAKALCKQRHSKGSQHSTGGDDQLQCFSSCLQGSVVPTPPHINNQPRAQPVIKMMTGIALNI